MQKIFAFLVIALLVYSTGCDQKPLYEGYRDFPDRRWVKNETAAFEFEVDHVEMNYNLQYTIRNTNKYPFQNLFLQYYLEDSTGNLLSKDLDNVQLFHPVTGVPFGNGLGDILVLKKPFLENYKFKNPGLYRLRIDHFMRADTLPEIVSIGIRVDPLADG